jgi:hypothetical protein
MKKTNFIAKALLEENWNFHNSIVGKIDGNFSKIFVF